LPVARTGADAYGSTVTIASQQAEGTAAERRLARLALDLHDGPLQDLAALAAELRFLRSEAPGAPAELVQGRIDEALDLLGSIEADVRELARSLESKKIVQRPLAALVQAAADDAELDGIDVAVRVSGDVDDCTPSQQIALYRVVQEALRNVRQHSGSAFAEVAISAGPSTIDAEIVDHGRGFDVGAAGGARTGRMGLDGMRERVRLLGGTLDVESSAGGPTRVRATIPRWRP
jgi:signal transduction histidine kinase